MPNGAHKSHVNPGVEHASTASRPAFASLVALVGTAAGFYVSIFSSEIRLAVKALPDVQAASVGLPHVGVALFLTLLFGLLLSANLNAQRVQSKQAQDFAVAQGELLLAQVQSQTKETREAQDFAREQAAALKGKIDDVLSIPPRGFLDSFEEFAFSIGMLGFEPSSDADLFDDRVRVILHAIASLAKQYDEAAPDIEYTACYYLYHSEDVLRAMTSMRREEILAKLTLTENNAAGLAGMAGLLELREGMAVSVRDGKRLPTASIGPLVLGVADKAFAAQKSNDGAWPVLPGAPWSVVSGEYFVAPTMDDAYRWLQERSDVTKQVQGEFRKYFSTGPGRSVKSFASLPIGWPEKTFRALSAADAVGSAEQRPMQPPPERVVGVLTIHASAPGVLRSRSTRIDAAKLSFVPLLQPFLTALMVETITARRLAAKTAVTPAAPLDRA
jgi:hypothetical protein